MAALPAIGFRPVARRAKMMAHATLRAARAMAIWREALPAGGTIVQTYLRSRGITVAARPAALRFHPRCPRPRDDEGNLVPPLPAMVALVERVERGPVAIREALSVAVACATPTWAALSAGGIRALVLLRRRHHRGRGDHRVAGTRPQRLPERRSGLEADPAAKKRPDHRRFPHG
jgi:hypothetical protein